MYKQNLWKQKNDLEVIKSNEDIIKLHLKIFLLKKIEVQLFYDVVSGIQQNDSVIYVYMYVCIYIYIYIYSFLDSFPL